MAIQKDFFLAQKRRGAESTEQVGNRLSIAENTTVTPRGRASCSDVHFSGFTDEDGVEVDQDDSTSLVVEAGVTVEQMFPDNGVAMFVDASVSHDVLSDSALQMLGRVHDLVLAGLFVFFLNHHKP